MNPQQEKLQVLKFREGNDRCFECNDKLFDIFSASINLGIFLCFRHSTQHSMYGRQISFVKDHNCNSWTDENIEYLKMGGNLQLQKYLAKKGMQDLKFNRQLYSSDVMNHYRHLLQQKVLKVQNIEELNDEDDDKNNEEQEEENKDDIEKSEYTNSKDKISDQGSEVQSLPDQDSSIATLTIADRNNIINEYSIKEIQNHLDQNLNIQDIQKSSLFNKGLYQKINTNGYKEVVVEEDYITLKLTEDNLLESQLFEEKQVKEDKKGDKINNKNIQQDEINKEILLKQAEQSKLIIEPQEINIQNAQKQNQQSLHSSNSLSSSSTSASSSSFFSSLLKSKNQEQQKPSKKEAFFSIFNKAKEKYQETKSSIKASAKGILYDINQKVHDHDNQIKMQMIKEDLRMKAIEAQDVIEEKATHFKDYAQNTYESVKQKIIDKMKEKKVDKDLNDVKLSIREKYLEFEVYTENFAHKKMKQIKNYIKPENIEEEGYEKIESEIYQLNNEDSNMDVKEDIKRFNSQRNIGINNLEKGLNDTFKQEVMAIILPNKQIKNNSKKSQLIEENTIKTTPQLNEYQDKVLFLDEQPPERKNQQQNEDDTIFKLEDVQEKDEKINNIFEKSNSKPLELIQEQSILFSQTASIESNKGYQQDKVLFLDEQPKKNADLIPIEDDSVFCSFSQSNS